MSDTTPSLFDTLDAPEVEPPSQSDSATSIAAAKQIVGISGELRKRVYAFLLERGADGATDEEGIDALVMSPSTYRPRRIECVEAGVVRDSGQTRKTKSGRKAVVWIAVKRQTDQT